MAKPVTYTLRLVKPMTEGQFAPILSRVNEIAPRAALQWNSDDAQCSFVSHTPLENLKGRVERALEAELGPSWRERVTDIAA